MDRNLEVGQKLLVLQFLKVPFPPRPSRSSIATSVDPIPTDRRLALAIAQWEDAIDRIHIVRS